MIMLVCEDCDWSGPESSASPVEDLSQRFIDGDVYTTVQCPECGALAHPYDPNAEYFRISIPGDLVRDLHQLVRIEHYAHLDDKVVNLIYRLIEKVLDHYEEELKSLKLSPIDEVRKILEDLLKCPDLNVNNLKPQTRRVLLAAQQALDNV